MSNFRTSISLILSSTYIAVEILITPSLDHAIPNHLDTVLSSGMVHPFPWFMTYMSPIGPFAQRMFFEKTFQSFRFSNYC